MKSRPALRPEMPGPWHLRRVNRPEPEAYRALYSKIPAESTYHREAQHRQRETERTPPERVEMETRDACARKA